jgi:hypothetical protein
MAVWEDSLAGAADISGDPQPTRPMTSEQIEGAAKRNTNRTQQGAQGPGGLLGELEQGVKQGASKVDAAMEKASKQFGKKKPKEGKGFEGAPQAIEQFGSNYLSDFLRTGVLPKNPFSPGDWFQAVKDDAGASWAAAHDLYDAYSYLINPDRINYSIRQTFAKDDARSRITQAFLTAMGSAPMGVSGLPLTIGEMTGELATGKAGPGTEQAVEKSVGEQVAEGSNPAMWAAPEGKLGMVAAGAGLPLAQGLLSNDQSQLSTSILWAGITGGILGMGHVPGPAREFLQKTFANWPGVEKAVKTAVEKNGTARKISQNPFRKDVPDKVREALDSANEEIEHLNKPQIAARTGLKVDQKTGEVRRQLTDKQRKQRDQFFKSMRLNDEKDLERYVIEHGLDPKQTKKFVKAYESLGFTDPLLSEGQPVNQISDPRQALKDLETEDPEAYQRAGKALASFHVLKEMADAGPWRNDESPVLSLLRGAVGFNHSLDIFEKNFRQDLKSVDPSLNGSELSKIVELGQEGQEQYDKLSTAGKYVVDMYRLYANMTRQYERRAGMPVSELSAFVPRINEAVSATARRRGGTPSRILTPEFAKHRLWRTEAVGKFASYKPGDLEPLRRQLGEIGKSLSHDDLATLQHIISSVGESDGQALTSFLNSLKSARQVRTTIDEWWKAGIDLKPGDVRMRIVPAFKTIGDHNTYMDQARRNFPDMLFNTPELASRVSKSAGAALPAKDPEIARIIKEKDRAAAEDLAKHIFPNKRTDLFDIMDSGFFSRQIKAAHTAEVAKELEKTQVKVGDGYHWAAVRRSNDARSNRMFTDLGYENVEGAIGQYQDYLFAPEVAKFIRNASRYRDLGWMEKLVQMEQKAVGLIMYSPLIHGMNMAGRIGAFAGTQALMGNADILVNYLKHGKELTGEQKQTATMLKRMEAWTHGVVTPHQARTVAGDMGNAISNSLGETKLRSLGVDKSGLLDQGSATMRQKLASLEDLTGFGKVKSWNENLQRILWSKISDFGVGVYHIEKEAAMRAGVPEENAAAWAARRANTWMGHVSEIDQNPNVHAISRLALFAPNWWRTFGELLAPIYQRSGINWSKEMQTYVAKQQVAAIFSLLAVQKLVGNGLNFVTSGHSQFQNQPGHQDDIELSQPWLLEALKGLNFPGSEKVDAVLGYDPNTGGHSYLENPFARQQRSVETLAGLQSGYQDWHPSDVVSGGEKFLAARASPLVNSLAALGNVDLYGTLSTQSWRNINPDHQMPDGWNLVYALMMSTPLSGEAQPLAREMSDRKKPFEGQPGPFGTTVPRFLADMMKGAPNVPKSVALSLAGVNAPYESSAKTRGTNLSDEDYRKIAQWNDQYSTQMNNISNLAMNGQITPAQWKDRYDQLSLQHRSGLDALMKGAPDYTAGTMGMVSEWDNLYTQAADPNTGQLNPDVLATLQAKFTQQHSQSEMDAMKAELRKNDQKYPMLALYHQSLDSYHSWQKQWADSNGVSVQKIQRESAEYSAVYSDRKKATQYLHQHPELNRYYKSRNAQFYRTTAGMMYGLFVDSSVAVNYAHRAGLTVADYEQLLAQEQA